MKLPGRSLPSPVLARESAAPHRLCDARLGRCGRRKREGSQLSHERKLVVVVPGFDDLAIDKAHHAHSCCGDWLCGGSDAEEGTGVLHGNRPPGNDHLAFFDGLVDLDMNRGEGEAEGFPKFAEGFEFQKQATLLSEDRPPVLRGSHTGAEYRSP